MLAAVEHVELQETQKETPVNLVEASAEIVESDLKEFKVEPCCDCSQGPKEGILNFLRNIGTSLDFIDDEVKLKWVTIFVFCSLLDIMIEVNSAISKANVDKIIAFLFYLAYVLLYGLVAAPMLWGNNPKSSVGWTYFGLFYNFLFLLYKTVFFVYADRKIGSQFRYFGLVASIISFIVYFYMACVDAKDDMHERMETLSSLPEVHRLNRASDREVNSGMFSKAFQFVYPTSDFDVGQKLDVPAKVYVTMFMGLFISVFVVGETMNAWQDRHDRWDKAIHALDDLCVDNDITVFVECLYISRDASNPVEGMGVVDSCLDALDSGNGCSWFSSQGLCTHPVYGPPITANCRESCGHCTPDPNYDETIELLWDILDIDLSGFYRINDNFLMAGKIGILVAGIYGLFGFLVIARAWRKKVLEIYYDAPTFHYQPEMFNIGGSFKFIGTIFFFITFGFFIVFAAVTLIVFVLSLKEFWEYVVWDNRGLIAGYIAYFALLKIFVEPFLKTVVTDGNYVNTGWEPMWRFCSFILECLYVPVAVLYAITTIGINIALMVVALVRPDIGVFPRGFESLQSGHAVFVSNCKAYVYRIRQMYMGYPLTKKEEMHLIEEELDQLLEDKKKYIQNDDWYMCLKVDEQIKLVKSRFEIKKYKIEVGSKGYYKFKDDEPEPIRVLSVNEEKGTISITRARSQSGYSLSSLKVDVDYFNIHLAADMTSVDVLDENLSWTKNDTSEQDAETPKRSPELAPGGEGTSPDLQQTSALLTSRKSDADLDEFDEPGKRSPERKSLDDKGTNI